MTLIEKLIQVYEKIDHIQKSGHNKMQNYDFVRAADMVRAVRKALLELKVYAEVNMFNERQYTIAREKAPTAPFAAVDVRCVIVFRDGESGETLTASGIGTGADTSDKAAYKAQTGAIKYALRNAFLVPDEADPEADESVDETPERGSSRSVPASEIPDFHDAQHEAPKPRPSLAAALSKPPAANAAVTPAPAAAAPSKPAAAPVAAEREPGDEPVESSAPPTEAELDTFRKTFAKLGDDLTTVGKLKASKGLPVNRKLIVFLLSITKAESAKILTKAQWEDFFKRAEAVKALENGMIGLAKLVNKANGIEETKK